MFRKLFVKLVRLLPVGVLVDALQPPELVRVATEKQSLQVSQVHWYKGGPYGKLAAKLQRQGACQANLTMGQTTLVFDVYRQAGLLASLRIREVPNGESF